MNVPLSPAPIATVVAGVVLLAAGYISPFVGGERVVGPVALILGVATLVFGFIRLGARTQPARRRLRSAGVLLGVAAVVAGLGIALFLTDPVPHAPPLVLGLPRRVAALWYLAGLLPLIGLPLVFAATFTPDRGERDPR